MHHLKKLLRAGSLHVVLVTCGMFSLTSQAMADGFATEPSKATQELSSINAEFERALIPVADNVHVAIGYGASTFSFIEGDKGIILIDVGQLPTASAAALKAYRKISQKPIAAIILTHSHGDHINGAAPFVDENTPLEIWGSNDFGNESTNFRSAGIRINKQRGIRQAGFKLPPEQRINNGVAPAVYPRGVDAFNPEKSIYPSKMFDGRVEVEISGVKLTLAENFGETSDQIYIWYPDHKIVFAGDNFYKSWPNLYAIRGTPYRDVQGWASAIERLRDLEASVLVGGHTRPVTGAGNVRKTLTTYLNGINHIFNKTIEGINLGLGPDALIEYAKLPPALANARVLRPYYGHPDWAIRSIFNGYLGWFDGNPTNLFPLPPKVKAEKMIALAGGMEKMMAKLRASIETSDFQWACQLADTILVLQPDHHEAMRLKAEALTQLALNNVTATARNYYLTSAQELYSKIGRKGKNK